MTAHQKSEFDLRVQLLRTLQSPQWDEFSRISGSIALEGELLEYFERLRATDEADWLGLGPSPNPGEPGSVFLRLQNGLRGTVQHGYAVKDLDGLLRFDRSRIEVLEPAFLADEDWATGEPNEPDAFLRYRRAVEFTQWLRDRADVAESDRLVFLLSEKLELPLFFTQADLASASFEGVGILKQLLTDDLHQDQRRAIAVKALIEMLGALPANDRHPFLLRNLPDFVERVKNGYALYVSEFSYEKVRDQVETARIEIAGKLNKTISDIQNQVLAIPVAAILVATQMKPGVNNWEMNLALVVASAIFLCLMLMILRNQRDSLGVLEGEIERQAALLQKEYRDVADRFSDIFKDLRTRKSNQEHRLNRVRYLVVAGFILSVVAGLWFSTQPASSPSASCPPATSQAVTAGSEKSAARPPNEVASPQKQLSNLPAEKANPQSKAATRSESKSVTSE